MAQSCQSTLCVPASTNNRQTKPNPYYQQCQSVSQKQQFQILLTVAQDISKKIAAWTPAYNNNSQRSNFSPIRHRHVGKYKSTASWARCHQMAAIVNQQIPTWYSVFLLEMMMRPPTFDDHRLTQSPPPPPPIQSRFSSQGSIKISRKRLSRFESHPPRLQKALCCALVRPRPPAKSVQCFTNTQNYNTIGILKSAVHNAEILPSPQPVYVLALKMFRCPKGLGYIRCLPLVMSLE